METKEVFNIVGIDPGVKNFAVSIQEISIRSHRYEGKKKLLNFSTKVIKSGLLKNTVSKIDKTLPEQFMKFRAELLLIIKKYNPVIIGIEQYQNRGFKAFGSQIEIVNIMIGMISAMKQMQDIQIMPISAIVWKNAIKRSSGDKERLRNIYKVCPFAPHEMDAFLIGQYSVYELLDAAHFADRVFDENEVIDHIKKISGATKSKLKKKLKEVDFTAVPEIKKQKKRRIVKG